MGRANGRDESDGEPHDRSGSFPTPSQTPENEKAFARSLRPWAHLNGRGELVTEEARREGVEDSAVDEEVSGRNGTNRVLRNSGSELDSS